MDGSRFGQRLLLVFAVTLALHQTTWAQSHSPSTPKQEKQTCKVYSLTEFADDPALCQWIADTIPQVIEPKSWQGQGVSYQPKLCIITFSQTAAVHGQVDEFLRKLKQALPAQTSRNKAATSEPALIEPRLVQASVHVPEAKPAEPTTGNRPAAYPIPAPLQAPKHLFHFIIRYEGDGVLDAAVTEISKKLSDSEATKESKDDKSKTEAGKPASMSQLLQFIIRYEGDGLIDANVVEFLKSYLNASTPREEKPAVVPTALPSPGYYPVPSPAFSGPLVSSPPPANLTAPNNAPIVVPVPTSGSKRMPPAEEPTPVPRP